MLVTTAKKEHLRDHGSQARAASPIGPFWLDLQICHAALLDLVLGPLNAVWGGPNKQQRYRSM